MASKKLYDLAVKTGEYQDRASGQTKGRWQNVGAVMQSDDGNKFIMLAKWFNPAGVPDLSGKGGESILVSMFKPQDQQQATAPAAPVVKIKPADDDIPF
jgi:hypothetical protein